MVLPCVADFRVISTLNLLWFPLLMSLFTKKRRISNSPSSGKKAPQTAEDWRFEAETAEEAGDWVRAVVCYRRALALSPFCTDLRLALEYALEEQILSEGMDRPRRSAARMKPRFFDSASSPANPVSREEFEDLDEDEFYEDEDEDLPPVSTPRRRTKAKKAGAARNLRRPILVGAACLAALLVTSLILVAAVSVTGAIGNLFADEDLPSVAEVQVLPDELKTVMTDANRMLVSGKTDEAVSALRGAYDEYPQFESFLGPALVQALRASGNSNVRGGKFENASDAFREATQVDGQDAINWIDLGHSLRDLASVGDLRNQPSRQREVLSEAEQAFQRALALSPNDSSALLGLAQVYNAKNNRQEAVATYEKLVAIAPSTSEGRKAELALQQLKPR